MLSTVLIFLFCGILLVLFNARKGKHKKGLEVGIKQLWQFLPVIVLAIILAGLVETLLPEEFVQNWLTREAGFRGVFLGVLGGMLLAMGPYASFPIIATIYAAGAGMGTVVALISGYSLLGLNLIPFETGALGIRFTLVKIILGFPLCLLAGLIAHFLDLFL